MTQTLMSKATALRFRFWLIGAFIVILLVALGAGLFMRSRTVMEAQLRDELRSTAAAAAMQFNGDALLSIDEVSDMGSPAFRDAVVRLRMLREHVPSLRFAYILRRTSSPHFLEFVADADALSSDVELDINRNGTVDEDEEPGFPGERYDISDIPKLQREAFEMPTADDEFTFDQWGVLISGYAPIRNSKGEAVAVLGIDMRAEDFIRTSTSIFSPTVLFFVLLAVVTLTGGFLILIMRHQLRETWQLLYRERSGLLQLTFHQLGEPLTIFKWSLESLKERKPTDNLEKMMPELMQNMEIGINRVSTVVDSLRDAEQVELRTLPYTAQRASLSEVIATVAKEMQPLLEVHKQTLEIFCENKLWGTFDPHWIAQVLHYILKNASDYSSAGSVITVSAAYKRNHLQVEVTDHGAGVPKAELSHVFEKFFRASNTSKFFPGTGLSLYTAKGILDIAGGSIAVRSEEGKGTTVTFTVPAA